MNKTINYGATPEDWAQFDLCLGLTADLLPVVSNPNAPISETSKMKAIGKTPSQYNRDREVVGLSKWTGRVSTSSDVERWSKEPDYGICVQTRSVRALDIDVTDQEEADAIWSRISWALGGGEPTRSRDNSSKCLVAFIVRGDMPKRVFKTKHGLVEFLATGQQFVAIGTHPSGARYRWDSYGGVPSSFPELTVAEFDDLWDALVAEFAIEAPKAGNGPRLDGAALAVVDETANALADAGLVLGYGNDGQLFLECPWKHEHSSDSGETEFAYFPKGTRGYEQGHFRCLHAGHMDKTDDEFYDALVGYANDFEDLPALTDAELAPPALKEIKLKKLSQDKNGIDATLNNVADVLAAPGSLGYHVVRDVFLDENMICPVGRNEWAIVDDLKQIQLRSMLERKGFKEIGSDKMRHAVALAGEQNRVDSAQEWLKSIKWDGVPRIENFFARYFGGIDTPYTRAVALYLWTALPGRVLAPGCQADMMPIFVGDQGLGKSTAIMALAPWPELFAEVSFNVEPDDLARLMKGKLIAEVPELSGLHTRALEDIKAFVTRKIETWVPKYQEKATYYARRCILIGTTNRTDILADTENRRFLPVSVGKVDVAAIKRDVLQLWAEGADLFNKTGIQWQGAQTLAIDVHQDFKVTDPWEEAVDHYLEDISKDLCVLQTRNILQDALGISSGQTSKAVNERIGKIMQVRGFVYGTHRDLGGAKKGWKWKM